MWTVASHFPQTSIWQVVPVNPESCHLPDLTKAKINVFLTIQFEQVKEDALTSL
jgi:hypothetical protein